MICESEHCIFNRGIKCTLGEVYINEQGVCSNNIPVSLNDELLNAEKERQLCELLRQSTPKSLSFRA